MLWRLLMQEEAGGRLGEYKPLFFSDADLCLSPPRPTDKDESDHPNNSFNPCSAHDHRCLQKHMAKMRDRSKMKVVGTPREEPRPVVSTSDPQMYAYRNPISRSGLCSPSKPQSLCVYKSPGRSLIFLFVISLLLCTEIWHS